MKKQFTTLLLCVAATGVFSQAFNCGDSLLDTRDGKKYATVLIGSACWMKQNLNYGTTITSNTTASPHYDMANNGIAERYAPMGNNANLAGYGALYEWDEMMQYSVTAGGQGLCPSGWHVPTDAEFQTMIVAAGATVNPGAGGNKLKLVGQGVAPNGFGTNTSGFSAKAAGDRDAFGIFYGLGNRFIFWTSTQTNSTSAYHYTLWNDRDTIERLLTQKYTGLSCRCVKNAVTGLNNKTKDDIFNIFPNPAQEQIVLILNTDFSNASYRVVNLFGQAVKEDVITMTNTTIPLNELCEGVYFISVVTDGRRTEKKIVITK